MISLKNKNLSDRTNIEVWAKQNMWFILDKWKKLDEWIDFLKRGTVHLSNSERPERLIDTLRNVNTGGL